MGWFGVDSLKTCIEIPVFCVLFSMFVEVPVFMNLIIYRTCYINLGYNQSECMLLGTGKQDNFTEQLDKIVEPHANVILLFLQMPEAICALLCLFVGSWSDRNGRKPILILTVGAQVIVFVMLTIYCFFPNLSPWYLFLSTIPLLLTGGFAAMLATCLSYVTDVSNENNRGMRLGVFEVCFSIGTLIGTLASSYIFDLVGYTGVFLIATCVASIALFFIVFILEESLSEDQIKICRLQEQPSFLQQIKDMTQTTFKKRRSYGRPLIIISVTIISLFYFAIESDLGIIFLFLQLKFGWSLQQFTIFISSRHFLSIVGTFFGIYCLHQKLHMHETTLVIIGLISSVVSSLVQGLATMDVHIYFAGALRLLSGCVNPMIRSLVSKVVEPDEVGKIFAIVVMCQSILQLVGSPLYTALYNMTLNTWPALYNFLTAAILFISFILSLFVLVLHYKIRQKSPDELNEEKPFLSASSTDVQDAVSRENFSPAVSE